MRARACPARKMRFGSLIRMRYATVAVEGGYGRGHSLSVYRSNARRKARSISRVGAMAQGFSPAIITSRRMALSLGTCLGIACEILQSWPPSAPSGMGEVLSCARHETWPRRSPKSRSCRNSSSRTGIALPGFEREAQLLAALNHPNIAAIHGLEESGSTRFHRRSSSWWMASRQLGCSTETSRSVGPSGSRARRPETPTVTEALPIAPDRRRSRKRRDDKRHHPRDLK